jgi:hypothetical protein
MPVDYCQAIKESWEYTRGNDGNDTDPRRGDVPQTRGIIPRNKNRLESKMNNYEEGYRDGMKAAIELLEAWSKDAGQKRHSTLVYAADLLKAEWNRTEK